MNICDTQIFLVNTDFFFGKHIIEKNTGLKIGNLYLVWINEVNDTYKVIPCKDLQAELKLMIEDYENTKNS